MSSSPVLTSVRERRWDEVNRLLDDGFFRHLLTAPDDVRAALRLLPEEWYDRYPRHRMTRSIAHATGPRQLVDEEVFDDFVRWVRTQESPDTRDLLGIETTHLRRMIAVGNLRRARIQADRVRAMIMEATDTRGFHDVMPSVLLRVGQVYLQVGDLPAAADSFVGARRFATTGQPHPFDRFVRSHLALVDALHDRFVDSRRRLAPVGDRTDADAGLIGQLQAVDQLVRALIEVSSGTRADADEALAGIRTEEGLSDLWWVGAVARARAEAQWGTPREGISAVRRELRDHGSFSGPDLLAGQLLRAELSMLHHLDGDLTAADDALADIDVRHATGAVRAALARSHLLRGRTAAARDLLGGPRRDDGHTSSAVVLGLVADHPSGEHAPAAMVSSTASALAADGAAYAAVQLPSPVREEILAAAFPGRPGFRTTLRYPSPSDRLELSARERQVLAALRSYSRSEDLAAHLHVSVNTIKTHRRNLYAKLGVRTRDEALAVEVELRAAGER